jgi:hypothetical protein
VSAIVSVHTWINFIVALFRLVLASAKWLLATVRGRTKADIRARLKQLVELRASYPLRHPSGLLTA